MGLVQNASGQILQIAKNRRNLTACRAEQTIHEYIHYYNNECIQVKLKGLSPMEYRAQSLI